MKIKVYTNAYNLDNSNRGLSYWLCHFAEGLKKHGHTIQYLHFDSCPSGKEIAVLWGIRNKQLVKYYTEKNIPFVVIERGFTPKRSEWATVGWNNLNGLGEFCNKDMPRGRWNKYHAHKLLKWTPEGAYILIIGQTQGDSALHDFDIEKWATDMQDYFFKLNVPCVYRPHPGRVTTFANSIPDLDDAIDKAFCVLTYNSSAGVASILRGKPTIALHPGSMIWDVSSHSVEDYAKEYTPDREQWAADFAYTQWTLPEFDSGDAWDHLRSYIE